MRIVAGEYGGRRLQVPSGRDIRPTSDKVRGAIFNALSSLGVVEGARVLDCFCGTGALGLEALSRGAAFCSFWDKDPRSLDIAKANAGSLDALGQSAFYLRDATRQQKGEEEQKYNLVFLDPPYRKYYLSPVLKVLIGSSCFAEDAVIVMEMEKGHEPILDGSFKVHSRKNYGDTEVWICFYTKKP